LRVGTLDADLLGLAYEYSTTVAVVLPAPMS
jgi:hypothetical protein